MTGRRLLIVVTTVLAALVGPPDAGAAGGGLPALSHLQPGRHADVHQRVPVQVVFVGLRPGADPTGIDAPAIVGDQPSSARLVARTTKAFEDAGIYDGKRPASAIGMTYDYAYRAVFADQAFEDAFFGYVSSIGIGPLFPTFYQDAYSHLPGARQAITSNWIIDATKAERWLAANAGPMLGVDTTRPTVFFINWFGRPDFRFHTYGFLDQRPGTAFPTGFTQGGQMVAWGGSPAQTPIGALGREARVWFYDVSAGPDSRTANWLLDRSDVTGDGFLDYRIPPIWEYGTTNWYLPFDSLSGDLAAVLRFVAVDALFGPSPFFDPALSAPLLADRVELDLNVFAGIPGHDPLPGLDPPGASQALGLLDPTRSFPADVTVAPLNGAVGRVFDCAQQLFDGLVRSCTGHPGAVSSLALNATFAPLDPYFLTHENQYLDGVPYELPIAAFDAPVQRFSPRMFLGQASTRPPGVSGWAYTRSVIPPSFFTNAGTLRHEVGHELGLSHPHDTYDPDYAELGPSNSAAYFMYAGDESYSLMSYLPTTDQFGQFDRDSLARWDVAARIDNANRILADIARSPRAGKAAPLVSAADAKAGEAQADLQAWDLPGASQAAAAAYHLILDAAAAANVKVEPAAPVADETAGHGALKGATDDLAGTVAPQPAGTNPLARYP